MRKTCSEPISINHNPSHATLHRHKNLKHRNKIRRSRVTDDCWSFSGSISLTSSVHIHGMEYQILVIIYMNLNIVDLKSTQKPWIVFKCKLPCRTWPMFCGCRTTTKYWLWKCNMIVDLSYMPNNSSFTISFAVQANFCRKSLKFCNQTEVLSKSTTSPFSITGIGIWKSDWLIRLDGGELHFNSWTVIDWCQVQY